MIFFSLTSQEAGISRKQALTIGVSVDHRRRNKSQESLELNVQRLKAYQAKLIVFPRKAGKAKKGDAEASELTNATQFKGAVLPIEQAAPVEEARAIKEEEKNGSAYKKLRYARSTARTLGAREKRARDKAEEEAAKVCNIAFYEFIVIDCSITNTNTLIQFNRRNNCAVTSKPTCCAIKSVDNKSQIIILFVWRISMILSLIGSFCPLITSILLFKKEDDLPNSSAVKVYLEPIAFVNRSSNLLLRII
jgi:hypothetical protein